MQAKKAIISDTILLEKVTDFSAGLQRDYFMASSGWFSQFKTRHGISLKVLHEEAASVDAISVSCSELLKVTADYDPGDTYNMDKIGPFY